MNNDIVINVNLNDNTSQSFDTIVDRLTKKIDVVSGFFEKFRKDMDFAHNFSVAAENLDAYQSKISKLIKTPIDIGSDFERQMSKIESVSLLGYLDSAGNKTQLYNEHLKNLTATAKLYGETTAASASEVAKGQFFLGLAGFEPTRINKAIEGLIYASKAMDSEVGQAADILSNVGTAMYGDKAADEFMRIADSITYIQTHSNIKDLAMIGKTLEYAAPGAKVARVSLEETLAIASQMHNVGIQDEKAGVALRMGFARLASGKKPVVKSLDYLGVKVEDNKHNLLNMIDILEQLEKKSRNLGSAQKIELFSNIFETASAPAFLSIMESVRNGELRKQLDAMGKDGSKVTGYAKKVSEVQLDNLIGQKVLLNSAIEGLHIKLYDSVKDILKEKVTWFTNLVRSINTFIDNNQELTRAVMSAAIGFVKWASIIGGVLVAASALFTVVASLKLGLSLLAYYLAPVSIGFLAIGGAATMVAKYLYPIKSLLLGIKEGLGLSFEGSSFKFLGDAIEKVKSYFVGLFTPIEFTADELERFRLIGQRIGSYVSGAIKSVGNSITWLYQMAKVKIDEIKGWFSNGLFSSIKLPDFSSFFSSIKLPSLPNFGLSGTAIIKTLGEGLKNGVGYLIKSIYDVFKEFRQYLPFSDAKKGPLSSLTASGESIITTIVDGIKNKSKAIMNSFINIVSGFKGRIINGFSSIKEGAIKVFSDISAKLAGKIDFKAISAKFQDIIGHISNNINPSTVTASILGIAVAIKKLGFGIARNHKFTGKLIRYLYFLPTPVKIFSVVLASAWKDILELGKAILMVDLKGMGTAIAAIFNTIVHTIGRALIKLSDFSKYLEQKAKGTIFERITTVFRLFVSGIIDGWYEMAPWLKNILITITAVSTAIYKAFQKLPMVNISAWIYNYKDMIKNIPFIGRHMLLWTGIIGKVFILWFQYEGIIKDVFKRIINDVTRLVGFLGDKLKIDNSFININLFETGMKGIMLFLMPFNPLLKSLIAVIGLMQIFGYKIKASTEVGRKFALSVGGLFSSIFFALKGFPIVGLVSAIVTNLYVFRFELLSIATSVINWFNNLSTPVKLLVVGVTAALSAFIAIKLGILSLISAPVLIIGAFSGFLNSIALFGDEIKNFFTDMSLKTKIFVTYFGALLIGGLFIFRKKIASLLKYIVGDFKAKKIAKQCSKNGFMSCFIPDKRELEKTIKENNFRVPSPFGKDFCGLPDSCKKAIALPAPDTSRTVAATHRLTDSVSTMRMKTVNGLGIITSGFERLGDASVRTFNRIGESTRLGLRGFQEYTRQAYLIGTNATGNRRNQNDPSFKFYQSLSGKVSSDIDQKAFAQTMGRGGVANFSPSDISMIPKRYLREMDELQSKTKSYGNQVAQQLSRMSEDSRNSWQRMAIHADQGLSRISTTWRTSYSALSASQQKYYSRMNSATQEFTNTQKSRFSEMFSFIRRPIQTATPQQDTQGGGIGKKALGIGAGVGMVGMLSMFSSTNAEASTLNSTLEKTGSNLTLVSTSMSLLDKAGSLFSQSWNWVKDNPFQALMVGLTIVELIPVIGQVGTALTSLGATLMSSVSTLGVFTTVAAGVGAAFAGWKLGEYIYNNVEFVREGAIALMGALHENIVSPLNTVFSPMVEAVWAKVFNVHAWAVSGFSAMFEYIGSLSLYESAISLGSSFIEGMASTDIIGSITEPFNSASSWLSNQSWFQQGSDMVNSWVSGLKSAQDSVNMAVIDLFSDTGEQYLNHSDAKKGPLSNISGAGRSFADTWIGGVGSRQTAVNDATTGLFSGINTNPEVNIGGQTQLQTAQLPQMALEKPQQLQQANDYVQGTSEQGSKGGDTIINITIQGNVDSEDTAKKLGQEVAMEIERQRRWNNMTSSLNSMYDLNSM